MSITNDMNKTHSPAVLAEHRRTMVRAAFQAWSRYLTEELHASEPVKPTPKKLTPEENREWLCGPKGNWSGD